MPGSWTEANVDLSTSEHPGVLRFADKTRAARNGWRPAPGHPMTVDDPDFSTVRFSTDDLPERDRFAIWREVLGRTMMRLDVERVPEHPFHSQAHVRALP